MDSINYENGQRNKRRRFLNGYSDPGSLWFVDTELKSFGEDNLDLDSIWRDCDNLRKHFNGEPKLEQTNLKERIYDDIHEIRIDDTPPEHETGIHGVVIQKREKLSDELMKLINGRQDLETRSNEELINSWIEMRKKVFGKYSVDSGHYCTFSECVKNDKIQTISEERRIYGCIESGIYHICKADIVSCRFKTLNHDGTYTCNLSGIGVGVLIEDHLYGKPDTGKEELSPIHEFTTEQKSISKFMIRNGIEDIENDGNRDNEGDSAYSSDSDNEFNIKIKFGINDKKPRSNKNEEFIRTKTTRRNKRRFCFDNGDTSKISSEAEVIICDLLYNKSERSRIDSIRVNEMTSLAEETIRKVYKSFRKGKVRSMIYIDDIYDNAMNSKRRLLPIDYDRERVIYYVSIIVLFWNIIMRSPYCKKNSSKFHIRNHILGVLYMIQFKFTMEINGKEEVIMQQDKYLYNALPSTSDLVEINSQKGKYTKNDLTKGINNIKKSISSISCELEKTRIMTSIRKLVDSSSNKLQDYKT
jgi:hypothetical protein